MLKKHSQNKSELQIQGINNNTSIQTPTFTPFSTGFSQIRSQLTENPEMGPKKSLQHIQISQQNLLSDSDIYNQQEIQNQTTPTSDIFGIKKADRFQNYKMIQEKESKENQTNLKNKRIFGVHAQNFKSQDIQSPRGGQLDDQYEQNKESQELLISQCGQSEQYVINSIKPEQFMIQNNINQIQKFNQSRYIESKVSISDCQISKCEQTNRQAGQNFINLQNRVNPYEKGQNGPVSIKQLIKYKKKYEDLKLIANNQKQLIYKLVQKVKWSQQQLEGFKKTSQAKLEASLQLKGFQINRLKQQIKKLTQHIQQLENKIKIRAKPPNIVIESYQPKEYYRFEENAKLVQQANQNCKIQLSQNLQKNKQKINSLTLQIHWLKDMNYSLKTDLNSLRTQMLELKEEKNQLNNKVSIMIQRQKHLKKIMQKQLNKIQQYGVQVIHIVEQQMKNNTHSTQKGQNNRVIK